MFQRSGRSGAAGLYSLQPVDRTWDGLRGKDRRWWEPRWRAGAKVLSDRIVRLSIKVWAVNAIGRDLRADLPSACAPRLLVEKTMW